MKTIRMRLLKNSHEGIKLGKKTLVEFLVACLKWIYSFESFSNYCLRPFVGKIMRNFDLQEKIGRVQGNQSKQLLKLMKAKLWKLIHWGDSICSINH